MRARNRYLVQRHVTQFRVAFVFCVLSLMYVVQRRMTPFHVAPERVQKSYDNDAIEHYTEREHKFYDHFIM
jgi:hypothetical protein